MRVGIHPVRFADESIPVQLAALGKAADDTGLDHVYLMDHHLQMSFVGPPDDPVLEGYTALGFLAAVTARVRLGLLVTGVTYRHPGILAKQVATLDVLSGGRAVLGLGAAWYSEEHAALGVPFPPLRERFEWLEDTLQVCRRMFADDVGPFDGRHVHLTDARCRPLPPQGAALPIVVGGGGERQTLRLVATYADACNLIADAGADEVAHKLRVLDEWCDRVGRNPAELTRTVLWTGDPFADPARFAVVHDELAELGIDVLTLVSRADHPGFIHRLPEVLSAPR